MRRERKWNRPRGKGHNISLGKNKSNPLTAISLYLTYILESFNKSYESGQKIFPKIIIKK